MFKSTDRRSVLCWTIIVLGIGTSLLLTLALLREVALYYYYIDTRIDLLSFLIDVDNIAFTPVFAVVFILVPVAFVGLITVWWAAGGFKPLQSSPLGLKPWQIIVGSIVAAWVWAVYSLQLITVWMNDRVQVDEYLDSIWPFATLGLPGTWQYYVYIVASAIGVGLCVIAIVALFRATRHAVPSTEPAAPHPKSRTVRGLLIGVAVGSFVIAGVIIAVLITG